MFMDTLRPVPNPVRGSMFIDTSGRICETAFPAGLTNSAGREPVGARIYKHATPDGVGNVIGSLLCLQTVILYLTSVSDTRRKDR
jgi:xanthine/uracil/vitamin C permease (AzgA family)